MVEKVINLLKENEPMRSGEIAEKLQIDKNEVTKIITLLKNENKITSPKRCYYTVD